MADINEKELGNLYEYQINKCVSFLENMSIGEPNPLIEERLKKLVTEAKNYFSHDLQEYRSQGEGKEG